MNDFTEIDLRSWKRRPKFEYYRTFQNQLVNLTVELDASALYHCAKSWGVSFFLLTLYAVLRAVDSVPQLRQRILPDGRVIEFRHTAVLTPVMAGEEEFSMALAEYAGTFDEFRKQAEPAVAAAKRGEFDPEVRKRNDYFCASCVPWFSFQSLSQAALTTDQSIVILAWGV